MQTSAPDRRFWRSAHVHLMISAAVVVPFILLEVFVARVPLVRFPFALFMYMSALVFSFSAIMNSLADRLRDDHDFSLGSTVARGTLLLVVGLLLVAIVIDQMPCFLGVPNCD